MCKTINDFWKVLNVSGTRRVIFLVVEIVRRHVLSNIPMAVKQSMKSKNWHFFNGMVQSLS